MLGGLGKEAEHAAALARSFRLVLVSVGLADAPVLAFIKVRMLPVDVRPFKDLLLRVFTSRSEILQ